MKRRGFAATTPPNMKKVEKGEYDYFSSPHHGRPPSDAAVRDATHKYILDAWSRGDRPSPEWIAAHPEYLPPMGNKQ